MDKAVLEQEATKLFGGATIDLKPYRDKCTDAWDLTVIPFIDKGVRFIRLNTVEGMAGAIVYLKKIQQNLLNLNKNGAYGMHPINITVDESKVGEEIAKHMPKENTKATFACTECMKIFKYPGPFSMHTKSHKKQVESISPIPANPVP